MSTPRPRAETRGNGLIGVLGTLSLVLAIFAPIIGVSGAISYSSAKSLMENTVLTQADVVSIERRSTGAVKYRHHYYFTTVTFAASEGDTVTTELPRTSDKPVYAVGESVSVGYDSSRPASARLADDLGSATTGGIVMMALGGVSALAVLVMILVIRRVYRGRAHTSS